MRRVPENHLETGEHVVKTAFDLHARTYRIAWGSDPAARVQRRVVHSVLNQLLRRPGRVLDLGCGPGIDAERLAGRGHQVVGVDLSPEMLEIARHHCPSGQFLACDLDRPERLPSGPFDAILANFGVLNCVRDLERLASVLRDRLAPGAPFLAVVMSRFCPAESLSLLLHGHPGEALRRRRRASAPVAGIEVPIRYLSVSDLRCFGRPMLIRGLGVVLPPPGHARRAVRWLAPLDRRIGRLPGVNRLGDHTLVVFTAADEP